MWKLLMNFLPQADIIYVVLAVLAVGAWAYEVRHLKAEGAAHELAALQANAAKLTAQNAKDNAVKEAAWKAESDKAGDMYEATLNLQSTAIAVLNGRLRNALANSGKVTVPGDSATPGESDGPTRLPGGVEPALEGVIAAAQNDAAQVIGLQDYVTHVCLNPDARR
jgi:hypothetical protein